MVEYMNGDVYARLEAASDGVAFSPITHDTASRNSRVIRLCLNKLDMPFRLLGNHKCITKDNLDT